MKIKNGLKKLICGVISVSCVVASITAFAETKTGNVENVPEIKVYLSDKDKPEVDLFDVTSAVYTGSAITPSLAVYDDNSETLVEGTDYDIIYTDNINVGQATITVVYKGNYSGSSSIHFTITARPLSDITCEASDVVYNGIDTVRPTLTMEYNGMTLVEDTDFEVVSNDIITKPTMTDNGAGKIVVRGKGNYMETKDLDYVVEPFNLVKVAAIPLTDDRINITELNAEGYPYTGSPITPKPTVTYKIDDDLTYTLIEGTDFNFVYTDNTEKGTATLTVRSIPKENGGFSGDSVTINFEITRVNLSMATIDAIERQEYRKGGLTPEPVVRIGDTVLTKDDDYTVEYENNINVGTATVKIKPSVTAEGENSATFEIYPRYGGGNRFFMVILDLDRWQ